MGLRPLIIDNDLKQRVAKLIELAAREPYSLEELKAMAVGFDPNDPATRTDKRINLQFTIRVHKGYTVTYTHEEQPLGLCRHLSISVDAPGKYPHPEAIRQLMDLFRFKRALEGCTVWPETYAADFIAINVIELI